MPKIKLTTKGAIDAIPFPSEGQQHFWCTDLRGFGMVVGRRSKTFVVQRDVNGRSKRISIGRYGEITLHEARTKAEQLMGQLRSGIDVLGERKAARAQGMTLREAWTLYEGHLRAKKRSPKTGSEYWANVRRYLADWLDRPLASISREEARRRHLKIGNENGEFAANQTMRALRAIWNRTRREHPALPESPTGNIDFYAEQPRQSVIPMAQLAAWYQGALKIENPVRRDLYIFLLLTGTRSEEARSLRWNDVDLDHATIRFGKTKTSPFALPLSDFLVELLRRRQACAHTKALFAPKQAREGTDFPFGSAFVFPAIRSKSGYITEPKLNTEDHNDERKLFPCEWTPHTLRHTYVTMAENKVAISDTHRRLLVNHAVPKSGDAHRGYDHPQLDDLRRSQQLVTAAFLAALKI